MSYMIENPISALQSRISKIIDTSFLNCLFVQIPQKNCVMRRRHCTSLFQGCTPQFQCILLTIIFLMNLLTWYVPKRVPISLLFIGQSFIIVLTISDVNDHSGDKTFLCCMTVSWSTQSVSKICTSPTCLFFEQWQRFLSSLFNSFALHTTVKD
jgi:hypothetical protein